MAKVVYNGPRGAAASHRTRLAISGAAALALALLLVLVLSGTGGFGVSSLVGRPQGGAAAASGGGGSGMAAPMVEALTSEQMHNLLSSATDGHVTVALDSADVSGGGEGGVAVTAQGGQTAATAQEQAVAQPEQQAAPQQQENEPQPEQQAEPQQAAQREGEVDVVPAPPGHETGVFYEEVRDGRRRRVEMIDEPVPEDCHPEANADYSGPSLTWGLDYKEPSAARCCQACKDVRGGTGKGFQSRVSSRVPARPIPCACTQIAPSPEGHPCMMWVWCGDPSGLCWVGGAPRCAQRDAALAC